MLEAEAHCQLPLLFFFQSTRSKGPSPPPALPGFVGTTEPFRRPVRADVLSDVVGGATSPADRPDCAGRLLPCPRGFPVSHAWAGLSPTSDLRRWGALRNPG